MAAGWNKGKGEPASSILRKDTKKSGKLRRALLEIGRKLECEICRQGSEWQGQKLTLQIDHVDGDPTNNVESNLRFLCPNCHSQTKTFGARNRRNWHLRATLSLVEQKTNQLVRSFQEEKRDEFRKLVMHSHEMKTIDFSKFGWVQKLSTLVGVRPQHIHTKMKRLMPEFYLTCFRRNSGL